jgi:hypothetical protein
VTAPAASSASRRPVIGRGWVAVALSICCAALTACGGTNARARTRAVPVSARVCAVVQAAARARLRGAKLRIADSDPFNIECLVSGQGITADVVAQASPQAWVEYDTTQVHQVQAFGSGAVHVASELPQNVRGVGPQAFWIPAQHELVTTNGTESVGGAYLTVTVTRHSPRGPSSLQLARLVAKATLPSAPRGPAPAPTN